MTIEEIIPSNAVKSPRSDEFVAKLNPEERCQVLACADYGIKREIIAQAYGINRRTIGHIVNTASQRYRATRKERDQLGKDDFRAKYLTEEVAKRIAAVTPKPTAENAPADHSKPSVRANGKAGINVVKSEFLKTPHRIEVQFFETKDPPGWWYRDIDGAEPDEWFNNGEDSLRSSQACLKMAELNLTEI